MSRRQHLGVEYSELEARLVPANTTPALVRDINTTPIGSGPGTNSSTPQNFVNLNGTLLFAANVGVNASSDLWRSDGTSSGTLNIVHNPGDGHAYSLNNCGGTLYFSNPDSTGPYYDESEPWRSDGTSAGTMLVRRIASYAGSGPRGFTALGNLVLFTADDLNTGSELWRTDGTSTGTVLVRDINPGSMPSSPSAGVTVNGVFYFDANDGVHGYELWRSDGTSSGTTIVSDISGGAASSSPHNLFAFNNILYFSAFVNGYGSNELWRSDGTASGTYVVRDINPFPASNDPGPSNFVNFGGMMYFAANDFSHGVELWRSDGTSSGTSLVRDIYTGFGGSYPTDLTVVGNGFFFAANSGSGSELWFSDGTSSGTRLVRDIAPGSASSSPTLLTNVAGALYFQANDGMHGSELWRSDGTSSGTTMIDLETTSSAAPSALLAINDTLYFSAYRSDVGVELFKLREDNVAPTVASITSTSANGTYSTGQSINITLNFSEPVTLAGGNLNVTLDSGGTVQIAPFSGTSASGTYTVLAGQSSPDLNVSGIALASGATLVDAGSNAANLALPSSNLANNSSIIVNPPPPTTVSFITVNVGADQRSRLTTIQVNFTNPVNAANFAVAGAITLTRTAGASVGTVVQTGAVGPNGRISVSPSSGMVSNLTLMFDNADGSAVSPGVESGSLTDGRWQLAIPAFNYTSTLNDPTLRRLFGDSNNDGTVDGTDFAQFGSAFGQTVANSPFDFNGDGTVDGTDFAQFGTRFGVTL